MEIWPRNIGLTKIELEVMPKGKGLVKKI